MPSRSASAAASTVSQIWKIWCRPSVDSTLRMKGGGAAKAISPLWPRSVFCALIVTRLFVDLAKSG